MRNRGIVSEPVRQPVINNQEFLGAEKALERACDLLSTHNQVQILDFLTTPNGPFFNLAEQLMVLPDQLFEGFRATATAALLRPRRAATARPHFCNGLVTSSGFLPDWISNARSAPPPCRLSAPPPSKLPLCGSARTFLIFFGSPKLSSGTTLRSRVSRESGDQFISVGTLTAQKPTLYPLILSASGKNLRYISTFERNPNFDFSL
jgi:hypothetical protein